MSEIKFTDPEPVGEISSSIILEIGGAEDTRIPEVDFQKNDLPIGTLLFTSEQVEQKSKLLAIQSLERLKGEILSFLEKMIPYDDYDDGMKFAYEDIMAEIDDEIRRVDLG